MDIPVRQYHTGDRVRLRDNRQRLATVVRGRWMEPGGYWRYSILGDNGFYGSYPEIALQRVRRART